MITLKYRLVTILDLAAILTFPFTFFTQRTCISMYTFWGITKIDCQNTDFAKRRKPYFIWSPFLFLVNFYAGNILLIPRMSGCCKRTRTSRLDPTHQSTYLILNYLLLLGKCIYVPCVVTARSSQGLLNHLWSWVMSYWYLKINLLTKTREARERFLR